MALVRQPKTAGFRLKSKYEYIVRRLSKFKCQKQKICRVAHMGHHTLVSNTV